jgi:hypothetical protein
MKPNMTKLTIVELYACSINDFGQVPLIGGADVDSVAPMYRIGKLDV